MTFLFYADIDAGNKSKPTYARLKDEVIIINKFWAYLTEYISLQLSKTDSPYDMTIVGGDIAYNLEYNNGTTGDNFFDIWQPLWTTRPIVFTPGNHDMYDNYNLLGYRLKMPLFNQTKNHYYSFDVGLAHFLTLDHDFYYKVADAQTQQQIYNWVENDLIAANSKENRTIRPWVIVFTHRPIYCSVNSMEDKPSGRCYNFYETYTVWDELFQKYGVDLYLAGHVHSYERMKPIYKNQSQHYDESTDAAGVQILSHVSSPIYIVEGGAGNDYYMPSEPIPTLNYSIMTDINVGFSSLTIVNETSLYWKRVKSSDGSIIDQFYLNKGQKGLPPSYTLLLSINVAVVLIFSIIAVIRFRSKSTVRDINGEEVELNKPVVAV